MRARNGFSFKGEISAKHGMPMGGLGTCTLSLDRAGRFQDVNLQNMMAGALKPVPPQSFFSAHFRSGRTGVGRVLQIGGAGGLPGVQGLEYRGHFPAVEIAYRDEAFPCRISLEAFSPFVPLSPDESSVPLAFFRFTIRNVSSRPVHASVAFSWQNDIAAEPFPRGKDPRGNLNATIESSQRRGVLMSTRDRTVAGSEYLLAGLRADGVAFEAVADWWQDAVGKFCPDLGPDAKPGMAGTHVLERSDDPMGAWRTFLETGRLPPEIPQDDGYGEHTYHCPVGAVVGRVTLKAGQRCDVAFALAWSFPHHYGDRPRARTFHGHRYARRFRGGARSVLDWAAPRRRELATRSRSWQTLIDDCSLPPNTRKLLVNLLYLIPRSTWWLEDGRFLYYESPSCINMCSGGDFWAVAQSTLFPDLQALSYDNLVRYQLPSGELPIFLGVGEANNPIFWKGTALPGFGLGAYWAWRASGRPEMITRIYPAAKRALQFLMLRDEDQDGVPDSHGIDQAFDTWPMYGAASYIASHTLAELAAMEKFARAAGDEGFAEWCRRHRARTTATVEKRLWNGRYYRLYADRRSGRTSETCLLHQVEGQLFADTLELGMLYREDRLASALDAIWQLNVSPCRYGARTGARPDGRGDTTARNAQSNCFNLLSIGLLCGLGMRHGRYDESLALLEKAATLYIEMTDDPWYGQYLFDADSGAHFYGHHYPSVTGIWHALLALLGLSVDVPGGTLTLAPPRTPVSGPVFSKLFVGTAAFSGTAAAPRLTLSNASGRPACFDLRIRLPASPAVGRMVLKGVPAERTGKRGGDWTVRGLVVPAQGSVALAWR